MNYKFLLIWGLLLFASIELAAQHQTKDIIYLENGEIIKGQLIEYNPKESLKIELEGGTIMVYESSKVLKMEKEIIRNATLNRPKSNIIKNKGMYHSIMGVTPFVLFSNRGGGLIGGLMGLGVEYAFGYHFHRLFGMGIQIGAMIPTGETFVPICANFRGYIMKKDPSLYYDVSIGYGLTLSGLGWDGARKGGVYFRPSVGVRFPTKKKGHSCLDVGYMIQLGGVHQYAVYAISIRAGVTF